MDPNSWFYTLSAIPQTLGAIIGLTATFIIFKLNHIESRLQKEYGEIKEWIAALFSRLEIYEITKLDDNEILLKLREGIGLLNRDEQELGFGGYERLSNLHGNIMVSHIGMGGYCSTEKALYGYLLEKERIFNSLLEGKKIALNRLKKSLILTSVPTVCSIFFLPFYGEVSCISIFSLPLGAVSCSLAIVAIMILLAIAAVLYTAYSVWKIAIPSLR